MQFDISRTDACTVRLAGHDISFATHSTPVRRTTFETGEATYDCHVCGVERQRKPLGEAGMRAMRSMRGRVMALAAFGGGCAYAGAAYARSELPCALAEPTPEHDKTAWSRGSACLGPHFITDAAEACAPAVVNLTVSMTAFGGALVGRSSGSGFILDKDGLILTNLHVVAEAIGRRKNGGVTVALQDGRTFEGRVLSYDSASDLAVVKVDTKSPLPTLKLGNSRTLRVGEWVVALGSPLHLQNSVTAGIVSCVERKGTEIGLQGSTRMDYIQTDAAINQGNSGGPLVNLSGEVIGINNMKALAADGVSFAIPIDTAKRVVNQLLTKGRVSRPYIGMKMLELNEGIASQLMDRDPTFPPVSAGILVPQVLPGSPAERGGLRAGDIIVEFDGQKVTSIRQILDILGDEAGKTYEVKVVRAKGQSVSLKIQSEEASPSM